MLLSSSAERLKSILKLQAYEEEKGPNFEFPI